MHFYTVKEILVPFISEFSSVAVFDTAILSVATIAPDNVCFIQLLGNENGFVLYRN